MTAVDHAELKRFGPEVTGVQSRYVLVHQLRASADIQDTQTKRKTGWATTSDRASLMREAANALEVLLSEIEGLKAERDDYRLRAAELKGKCDSLFSINTALNEEVKRHLRTQAPDSWRPDREAIMAIIDANKYEPWTVDRAGQMADAILAVRPQDAAMTAAFVPIDGQCFTSEQDWINRATRVLTGHAQYNNTEHGEASGWRGPHFTALSFDQAGRRVRNGADFKRATVEGTYPVWWIWPDQIVPALRPQTAESGK